MLAFWKEASKWVSEEGEGKACSATKHKHLPFYVDEISWFFISPSLFPRREAPLAVAWQWCNMVSYDFWWKVSSKSLEWWILKWNNRTWCCSSCHSSEHFIRNNTFCASRNIMFLLFYDSLFHNCLTTSQQHTLVPQQKHVTPSANTSSRRKSRRNKMKW